MTIELPELPYAIDALEPHMSRETLEYHHGKHHKGYVDNVNKLLDGSSTSGDNLEEIILGAHEKNQALFNNAAQHYNHNFFWKCMKPDGGGSMSGGLELIITEQFSSIDSFKSKFVEQGKARFGSGWVWLAARGEALEILTTPNGENPLVHGAVPLLGCDVWEHAYYLDHRNNRGAYLETFLSHLVNWSFVADCYAKDRE